MFHFGQVLIAATQQTTFLPSFVREALAAEATEKPEEERATAQQPQQAEKKLLTTGVSRGIFWARIWNAKFCSCHDHNG